MSRSLSVITCAITSIMIAQAAAAQNTSVERVAPEELDQGRLEQLLRSGGDAIRRTFNEVKWTVDEEARFDIAMAYLDRPESAWTDPEILRGEDFRIPGFIPREQFESTDAYTQMLALYYKSSAIMNHADVISAVLDADDDDGIEADDIYDAASDLISEILSSRSEATSAAAWNHEIAFASMTRRLDAIEVESLVLMKLVSALAFDEIRDQANEFGTRLVPIAHVDKIRRAAQIVVPICVVNNGIYAKCIGTGFLHPSGYVITCGHVVDDAEFWTDGALDLSRIHVCLPSEDGTYPKTNWITFRSEESSLVPKTDAACLKIVEPKDADLADRLRKALTIAGEVTAQFDPGALNAGSVFGISAMDYRGPGVTFIPPGRVIFPASVEKDARDLITSDPNYVRTIVHLFSESLLRNQVLTSNGVEAMNGLLQERYETECDASRCYFHFPLDDKSEVPHRLNDPEFIEDRSIRCVGFELATIDGNSGSPLFVMRDDGIFVVAMHSSRIGGDRDAEIPPGIRFFARGIPFDVIHSHLHELP